VNKILQKNVSTIWGRLYWYEKESEPEDGKIPERQKIRASLMKTAMGSRHHAFDFTQKHPSLMALDVHGTN